MNRFFITVTPELLQESRAAVGSRPDYNDVAGHWGPAWEGVELSIRLAKETFTNGEPVVACVTVRNTSYKVRALLSMWGQEEKETRFKLRRGEERVLGENDPKPWESFQQRAKHLTAGSASHEPLLPGTQRQFFRNLSKVFDLRRAGTYYVQGERLVFAYNSVPSRPGYITASSTNISSGTATFRVLDSAAAR
jgi:hypothetical protein